MMITNQTDDMMTSEYSRANSVSLLFKIAVSCTICLMIL